MNSIKFDFLTGGNALFTVGNDKGKHYTYRIRKPEETTPYFVSLLVGPDNGSDYQYIGVFIPNASGSDILRMTAKSKISADSLPVKVFRWAATVLRTGQPIPSGYTIQHEGKCCRCGRRLTVPESIESGIGPECKAIQEGKRDS